ncbi:unnamed protein product [Sphagnum tenellum]
MRSVLTLMGEGTYCYGSWWSTEPSRENDFHEIDEITILRTKSYNLHAVDFSAWNDWQQYYRAVSTNAKRNAAKAAKSDPAIRITHNGLTFHDALEMIRMRRKMFKRKGLLSSGLFSSALQFLFRMVLMSDHVFVTRIYYHEKLSAFMSGVRFGEHIYYIDGASLEDNGGSAWYLMLKNIKMFYDAHRGGKFIMGSDPPGTATIWDGLKSDDVTGYKSFRRLADAFAEKGFPTVRIHYPGTGNSANPGVADYWELWRMSVHRSIEWLRTNYGVTEIVLCGFRFGAMIAASIAEQRDDVTGLMLIAPVLRGKSYIRQLMMETNQTSASIEIGCVDLTSETIQTINSLCLEKIVLKPYCEVAIFGTPTSPLRGCIEAWRKSGLSVTSNDLTGLEAFLRPTFANHEADADLGSLLRWFIANFTGKLRTPPILFLPSMAIHTAGCVETPVFFGNDKNLFGVLCHPANHKSTTVVIMGNTSGDPHCASATVDLARQLANQGVATFRIDFSGIGDSLGDGTHLYETLRNMEYGAAIDMLETMGYRRFVAEGLCSGAFSAYYAAIYDPRITCVLLINLQFFKWTSGFPLENLTFRKTSDLVQLMATGSFWRKFIFKLRNQQINFRRLTNKVAIMPSFALDGVYAFDPSLANRPVLFLVCDGDCGSDIVKCWLPNTATVKSINGLDHSVSLMNIRQVIYDRVKSIATQQRKNLPPLTDDTHILNSGLDSLCVAILIATLDDELSVSPFDNENINPPITIGDLVTIYENAASVTL